MRLDTVHMGSLFKKWLLKVGFKIQSEKPQYKIRLLIEAISIIAYTIISIVLVCKQNASFIVLGLNILCVFRILIHNTINASASKVRSKDRRKNISDNLQNFCYYHIKVAVMAVTEGILLIVFGCLLFEKGSNAPAVIKALAILALGLVCVDECDEKIIYAYNAILY